MAVKDKTTGMKSAYELALERMEKQGIERPREETFSDEAREGTHSTCGWNSLRSQRVDYQALHNLLRSKSYYRLWKLCLRPDGRECMFPSEICLHRMLDCDDQQSTSGKTYKRRGEHTIRLVFILSLEEYLILGC